MRLMRISRLALGVSLSTLALPAAAQTAETTSSTDVAEAPTMTLRQALTTAYNTNPDLASERASLRATDENVPIQRASGLPSVNSSGGYTENIYNSPAGSAPVRQVTAGVDVSVPVFQGGAVRNSVRAAETRVEAGRAGLRSVETDLFTQVVTVYVNVIRDEAIVRLNQQNVHVLEVNLQATRDRFEVGDLTRTDVAQSEARLAIARSQLRGAEAQLIASREAFIRVVGVPPGRLAPPPALPHLPGNAAEAVSIALEESPVMLAAKRSREATKYDVQVAKAGRLPRVSVGVGTNYYNYLGSVDRIAAISGYNNDGVAVSGGVTLTVPLFQGGHPAAQVRQAEARESIAVEQETLAERTVVSQARSAYAQYSSSLRVIESSKVAVDANRLSLEGVRAENSVGSRTILDILNAEQEFLNSQVQYVTAERDSYVAGFTLLAIMGRAEAVDLGLDGGPLYDPTQHYDKVRRRWTDWGTGEEPAPSGTRTVDTPVQTPDVSETSDPLLQRPVDTTPYDPSGE